MKYLQIPALLLLASFFLVNCGEDEPQTTVETVKEKASAAQETVTDAAADAGDMMKEGAEEMMEDGEEMMEDAGDMMEDGAEAMMEEGEEMMEDAGEMMDDAAVEPAGMMDK